MQPIRQRYSPIMQNTIHCKLNFIPLLLKLIFILSFFFFNCSYLIWSNRRKRSAHVGSLESSGSSAVVSRSSSMGSVQSGGRHDASNKIVENALSISKWLYWKTGLKIFRMLAIAFHIFLRRLPIVMPRASFHHVANYILMWIYDT